MQDGISKVLEGNTTLEELLKIIELEDDNFVDPTGLENAIEDLLTQNIEEINSQDDNKLIPSEFIKENNNDDSKLFDDPNTLETNSSNEINSDNIQNSVETFNETKTEESDKEIKPYTNISINFDNKKNLFSNKNKFF